MTTPGPTYLGVDLGTSGLKLTMVGESGRVVAETESAYSVSSPQQGYAEIDPAEWEVSLSTAMSRLLCDKLATECDVAAVGVTGQMHGVVLVDHENRPLRPALLWPDRRATGSLVAWRALDAGTLGRLRNPLVAGMAGPMLGWLREHEAGLLTGAALVRSPKDWLRTQLTGDRVTERTDASATLLWDVVSDDWCDEAVGLAGITRGQLPEVVACDVPVGETGRLSQVQGGRGNRRREVPVVAGGADTACALTALAATQPVGRWGQTLAVNLGTGIQLLRPGVAASAAAEPLTHLYADTDGGWYEMLAVQNGGLALSWVQETLGLVWDEFVSAARSSPAGCNRAVFIPWLTGERGGVASPGGTAGWSGLSQSVGRADLARAAFEALAFTIRRGVEVIGGHDGPVLLSGGGAREPWVRQLVADVLQRPLAYAHQRSMSAVGAAMLAARGVGARISAPARAHDVVPSPDPVLADAYDRWLAAVGHPLP